MCGVAIWLRAFSNICGGLSPRVRGSHTVAFGEIFSDGSIPTCAGQPASTPVFPSRPSVYPHVCGAASHAVLSRRCQAGLSPRVRGSLEVPTREDERYRSIPTCAGQPHRITGLTPDTAVYPHVCGAASNNGYFVPWLNGLSPRVRGSRIVAVLSVVRNRSIPTCAGQPFRG